MAVLPPPPINDKPGSFVWLEWYRQLRNYVSTSGSVPWNIINFSGSNITDIALRDHNNMQGLQGGSNNQMNHLTNTEYLGTGTGTFVKDQTPTITTPVLNTPTLNTPIIVTTVPASATDTGTAGMIAYDTNYIYMCVATDTWKRATLSTF